MSMVPIRFASLAVVFLARVAVLCGVIAASADAAPISYTIVDNPSFQNGSLLSGTITTDGSLGVITGSNVLSWTWTITDTTSAIHTVTSSSTASLALFSRVEASATQLTLPVPAFGESNAILRLVGPDTSVYGESVEWNRYAAEQDGSIFTPNRDLYGGYDLLLYWQSTVTGTTLGLQSNPDGAWIVAQAAVPEPSSHTIILAGGVCSALAMARRRRPA